MSQSTKPDEQTQRILAAAIDDDRTAGRFRVSRHAFTHQGVFETERDRIFGRCWLFVAHASEVRNPGQFVTREVAGKSILLTRDKDGRINAFFNACTHRGAAVAREKSGTGKIFSCPYHGWVFDNEGRMIDMPGRASLPEHATDNGALDLPRVPRLEEFKGFIFICYDEKVEPLVDYLADAADYLAYVADHGPQGMEVVGGTQEYSANANWKMLSENSYDGYHGQVTHSTYFDYIRVRDGKAPVRKMGAQGWVNDLGNGHAVGESVGVAGWGRPYARWVPGYGEAAKPEIDALATEIVERLGEERGNIVVNGDRNLVIFPNLVVNDIMAVTIRTYYPVAPNRMLVNSWALAPIGESAASRDRRMKSFVEFLGPAGFATPDDVEMLESAQRSYAAAPELWNDCSRGMQMERPSKTEELQLRTFWRRWSQLMNGKDKTGLKGP
ncbi:MAG: aromatic ring-hydroxylating dioxygenase subunit alpha [Burkholderiaceae bacterium]|nr:aromatic ring-hydroxylating dioxygenase subunit alpha [Burkholderiaceae bacterium]